ncbi:methionine ABC transporter ATP-binding protein [Microbacterium sp. NPDC003461]
MTDTASTSPEVAALVEFERVSRVFPGRRGARVTALDEVTLRVPRGSIFGVIGHSGAGKSTLVRLVNALERPTSGVVRLDGVDLAALDGRELRAMQKRTGMVFQQFHLLETITVRENVALPLRLDGVPAGQARTRADEALAFVGLAAKADAHPGDLSGGQKQRVGIARAIVRNPEILLCDEATSALDPTTTEQILGLLRRINREYGTTILVITHEMDVIKDLCHEVAVMEAGRVVEQGSVLDVFVRPRSATTSAFVESVVPQTLPARVVERIGGDHLWRLLLLDEQVTAPIVATLIAEIGVGVNILHADMTEIQQHTVGQLIIQLDGDPSRIRRARQYLEDAVLTVTEVRAA